MSIDDQIRGAVSAGKLYYLEMEEGDPERRAMLLHIDIRDLLACRPDNLRKERKIGRLRADLQMFVKGELISMCFEPFQHKKTSYMGRYDPVEESTWAIRSRDPNPGMRIFGRFAKKNVFIALNYEFRSVQPKWSNKKPLGDKHSLEHQLAMIETKERWKHLFNGIEPVKGEDCHDYISERVFAV